MQEFINKYNGKAVDRDGAFGAQCVDLATQWTAEAYGVGFLPTPYSGGARDLWEGFDNIPSLRDNFVRIANTPDFVPQEGDLVIWNANYGQGYGHVSIATGKGDRNTFESFDQNWGGQYAHLVAHNYDGVYGVLRHKSVATPKPTINRMSERSLWLKVDTAVVNPVDEPGFRYPYPKNTKLTFAGWYDYRGVRYVVEKIVLDNPAYSDYRAVRSDQTTHIDPTPNILRYDLLPNPAKYETILDATMWRFDKPRTVDMTSTDGKLYPKGTIINFVGYATHRSGTRYLMRHADYYQNPKNNIGFNMVDVKPFVSTPPVSTLPPEATTPSHPADELTAEHVSFITQLYDFLKSFFLGSK